MLKARFLRRRESEVIGLSPHVEKIFIPIIAIVIFISGHAFAYYFAGSEKAYGAFAPKTIPIDFFYLRLSITLPFFILSAPRFYLIFDIIKKNIFIILILTEVSLSFLWSSDFSAVKNGIEEYIMTYVIAFFCASFIQKKSIIKSFYIIGCLCVFTTLIWVTLFPSISVYHLGFPGKWRGVYYHKNTLGQAVGMLFPIMAFFGAEVTKSRLVRAVVLAGAVLVLIKAGSGSGLVVAAVGTALTLLQRRIRRDQIAPLVIILGPIALLATSALMVSGGYILTALGKDPTLTGRTDIWSAAILLLRQTNIWIGTGIGTTHTKEFGYVMQSIVGFAYDTHNGALTIITELGIVGLFLFIGLIGMAFLNAPKTETLPLEDRRPTQAFQILLCCWLIAMSVESGPVSMANTLGIMAIIAVFALGAPPVRSWAPRSLTPPKPSRRRFGRATQGVPTDTVT